MSARTILNPTNINTISNISANAPTVAISNEYNSTNLDANVSNSLDLVFDTYFSETDTVLYTAYSTNFSNITCTTGTWSSNPSSTSTIVNFSVFSTVDCTGVIIIASAIKP